MMLLKDAKLLYDYKAKSSEFVVPKVLPIKTKEQISSTSNLLIHLF